MERPNLPTAEDVLARLRGEEPTPQPIQHKIDLHALFYAALMRSLTKRQERLVRPKPLRGGHLRLGINPFRGRHVIARVKRAQWRNAQKGRRVYKRANHGGHF